MTAEPALPPGWQLTTIGRVGEVRLGRQRSPKNHTGPNMRPYLRAANLTWHGIDLEDVKEMHFSEPECEVYELRDGDVLLSEASGSPSEVGKPGVWRGQIDRCCFQNTLLRVRASPFVTPDYLRYFVLREASLGVFARTARGVGIHHLGAAALVGWRIPLPPAAEQHRIVQALEEELSKVDVLAKSLRSTTNKLESLRTAILEGAASGRRSGPATAVSESLPRRALGRNRGNETLFDFDSLPGLPVGWQWASAADACDVVTNGDTPAASEMNDAGEIPYIKVHNLTMSGALDFTVRPTFIPRSVHEGALARSRILPGDVLMNIVGPPLQKVSLVPLTHAEWNTNQAVVVFRPSPDHLLPEILSYWLQTDFVFDRLHRTSKATVGQRNLALSACRALPIPVPPMTEQVLLKEALAVEMSIISATDRDLQRRTRQVNVLRRSILAAAFRGELVPQDPTDLPVVLSAVASAPHRGRRKQRRSEGTAA